jgi:hypothetical protein
LLASSKYPNIRVSKTVNLKINWMYSGVVMCRHSLCVHWSHSSQATERWFVLHALPQIPHGNFGWRGPGFVSIPLIKSNSSLWELLSADRGRDLDSHCLEWRSHRKVWMCGGSMFWKWVDDWRVTGWWCSQNSRKGAGGEGGGGVSLVQADYQPKLDESKGAKTHPGRELSEIWSSRGHLVYNSLNLRLRDRGTRGQILGHFSRSMSIWYEFVGVLCISSYHFIPPSFLLCSGLWFCKKKNVTKKRSGRLMSPRI